MMHRVEGYLNAIFKVRILSSLSLSTWLIIFKTWLDLIWSWNIAHCFGRSKCTLSRLSHECGAGWRMKILFNIF